MEALGIKVVWFRPSSKKFNSPGFHTLETRGTIYLNADANMSSVRAKAYEEVFHDIQMFRPEIAQAYSQQVGLAPIYAAGAQYAEGQAESAAKGRADAFARIQAAVAAAGIEGVDVEVPAAVSRIGAARLEQEGEANAFGPTAARVGGRGVLSPLVRFAARRGLMGREVAGAMSVIDAVARAAAVEKAAGVKPDATLSPLGRTLLWMEDMSVDIPADRRSPPLRRHRSRSPPECRWRANRARCRHLLPSGASGSVTARSWTIRDDRWLCTTGQMLNLMPLLQRRNQ
jgi:hypothetical protein